MVALDQVDDRAFRVVDVAVGGLAQHVTEAGPEAAKVDLPGHVEASGGGLHGRRAHGLRGGCDRQADRGQATTTGSVAVGRPFRKTFITDINCSFRPGKTWPRRHIRSYGLALSRRYWIQRCLIRLGRTGQLSAAAADGPSGQAHSSPVVHPSRDLLILADQATSRIT